MSTDDCREADGPRCSGSQKTCDEMQGTGSGTWDSVMWHLGNTKRHFRHCKVPLGECRVPFEKWGVPLDKCIVPLGECIVPLGKWRTALMNIESATFPHASLHPSRVPTWLLGAAPLCPSQPRPHTALPTITFFLFSLSFFLLFFQPFSFELRHSRL